ncbi:GFA family protein [Streptomyces atratus]|uniref:GFA family protein n=1 Tax=Streptomyces atratus TaxID=1893 RepID=UPI003F699015
MRSGLLFTVTGECASPYGARNPEHQRGQLRGQHTGTATAPRVEGDAGVTESTTAPDLRTGRCQCGDIAYEVTGVPDDPHLCSCEHCTLLSGSPAMSWAGFRRETLIWTGRGGEPTWYSTWLLRTTRGVPYSGDGDDEAR